MSSSPSAAALAAVIAPLLQRIKHIESRVEALNFENILLKQPLREVNILPTVTQQPAPVAFMASAGMSLTLYHDQTSLANNFPTVAGTTRPSTHMRSTVEAKNLASSHGQGMGKQDEALGNLPESDPAFTITTGNAQVPTRDELQSSAEGLRDSCETRERDGKDFSSCNIMQDMPTQKAPNPSTFSEELIAANVTARTRVAQSPDSAQDLESPYKQDDPIGQRLEGLRHDSVTAKSLNTSTADFAPTETVPQDLHCHSTPSILPSSMMKTIEDPSTRPLITTDMGNPMPPQDADRVASPTTSSDARSAIFSNTTHLPALATMQAGRAQLPKGPSGAVATSRSSLSSTHHISNLNQDGSAAPALESSDTSNGTEIPARRSGDVFKKNRSHASAQRKLCCVHCAKEGHDCTAEATCKACSLSNVICTYLLCRGSDRCKAPNCHYVHADQCRGRDWNTARGSLPSRRNRAARKGKASRFRLI